MATKCRGLETLEDEGLAHGTCSRMFVLEAVAQRLGPSLVLPRPWHLCGLGPVLQPYAVLTLPLKSRDPVEHPRPALSLTGAHAWPCRGGSVPVFRIVPKGGLACP